MSAPTSPDQPPASGGPVPGAGDGIVLWHVPLSRSMQVLWLLEELDLPFDLHIAAPGDATGPAAAFRAMHPSGRVPALQVDGRVVHEPGAMIEYLCETRGPQLGRAPGDDGRLGWLDWLHFAETLAEPVARLAQAELLAEVAAGGGGARHARRLETERLDRGLALVDATLTGRDWLMADGFSAVDCAVGWAVLAAGRSVALSPGLRAYAERCVARPAYRTAQDNERAAGVEPNEETTPP